MQEGAIIFKMQAICRKQSIRSEENHFDLKLPLFVSTQNQTDSYVCKYPCVIG